MVLQEVADRLKIGERLPPQQIILKAWQDLFLEKKLCWGYDIDNPNVPFFHIPQEATIDEDALVSALEKRK